MSRLACSITIAALALFTAAVGAGQTTSAKKSYTFHGKVEAIKEKAGSLTVNGEDVPGWMAAMTMDYKVDNTALLKKVRVGDEIVATVYDGDMMLHKIKVTPAKGTTPKGNGDAKPTK
ncbi:MAG: hypothetical protein JWN34_5102 [Bryobacterales bacterium]|jgi:Cu/Ag efflux protein CusF|nr:hypothetical protein [Bryobacterales bacterium]